MSEGYEGGLRATDDGRAGLISHDERSARTSSPLHVGPTHRPPNCGSPQEKKPQSGFYIVPVQT